MKERKVVEQKNKLTHFNLGSSKPTSYFSSFLHFIKKELIFTFYNFLLFNLTCFGNLESPLACRVFSIKQLSWTYIHTQQKLFTSIIFFKIGISCLFYLGRITFNISNAPSGVVQSLDVIAFGEQGPLKYVRPEVKGLTVLTSREPLLKFLQK